MTPSAIDGSQRQAAKVVGLAYLLALPPALFAGIFVASRLIVPANAAATAQNIVAHERLFRLGVASDLGTFALDVVLITALYLVLKPVHRGLALLATFWGLVETALFVAVTLKNLDVLQLLSGADYLRPFEADRLQALARLAIGAHSAGYSVGLVFAGLRSTVFAYLWFRSGYIPKPLAAWGVFASLLLAACTSTFVVAPELAKIVTVGYYGGPIFLFELSMGFWLLLKDLRQPVQPMGGSLQLP
jgi:hypothetical protein